MLNHEAISKYKSKIGLGSIVDGGTEFDLYVDSIEVRSNEFIYVGNDLTQIHYVFESYDLPYRKEDNGSLLITLNEIERFITNKGLNDITVSFESAYYGAIYLYEKEKIWSLHGITKGYT